MNVFTQLFSTMIALIVLAGGGYIFAPSNSCERISNASRIAYGVLGGMGFISENLIRRDATETWHFAEESTRKVHTFMAGYFGQASCEMPALTLYGRAAGEGGGGEWLQANDPELYEMLRDADSPDVSEEGEASAAGASNEKSVPADVLLEDTPDEEGAR